MKSAIQSVDVSYFVHATEDSEKVADAVRELVGGGIPFSVEEMEGHFGNSIRKVSIHLKGEDATRAFARLISRMPGGLREAVAEDIDRLIDEHSSLYMRFDKQCLVKGEMAAGNDEAIRLKVKPRAYLMQGRAKEFFLTQLKAP